VSYTVTLGSRQRTSELDLQLECSLGEDFGIELPAQADITSLGLSTGSIPVRKDGSRVIVPLQPGQQNISVQWNTDASLGTYASVDRVSLPVESANISTVLNMPESRWILWTHGSQRGPAVKFWVILICSLIGAQILARVALSPLKPLEWTLLGLGLTQMGLLSLIVVAWFFLLAWRGTESFQKLSRNPYNLMQAFLVVMTAAALLVLLNVLGCGFLGQPEMFIAGNDSTSSSLHWYQAHAGNGLPEPGCVSVSIWWYRLLMLGWALWLASSLTRWLTWEWGQFSKGGLTRKRPSMVLTPPPLPKG
jgi:hypothetical protein